MELTTFHKIKNFFEHPSFQSLESVMNENIGDWEDIFQHIIQQPHFNPEDILKVQNRDLQRIILMQHKLFVGIPNMPIFRHRYNPQLIWTPEELAFFPSLFNDVELQDITNTSMNFSLKKSYHESLMHHFSITRSYHPLLWELPCEHVEALIDQHPDFLNHKKDLYQNFTEEIISELRRQNHEILDTMVLFGHKETNLWRLLEKTHNRISGYLPYKMINQHMWHASIPVLSFMKDKVQWHDLSNDAIHHFMLKAYCHYKNDSDAFLGFCFDTKIPFFRVPFTSLMSFMSEDLILDLIAEIPEWHMHSHPENKQWLLDTQPCLYDLYQEMQNMTSLSDIFEKDNEEAWCMLMIHLMDIEHMPQRDTMLSLWLGMTYDEYFHVLNSRHSKDLHVNDWKAMLKKRGILDLNLSLIKENNYNVGTDETLLMI